MLQVADYSEIKGHKHLLALAGAGDPECCCMCKITIYKPITGSNRLFTGEVYCDDCYFDLIESHLGAPAGAVLH